MTPIDIQVSRSKVTPILYMLGKGALVFYKHLYYISNLLQAIWLVDGGHMPVPHFSDIA